MHLHTEIEIDASPERVWSILTAFGDYAAWNPFIRSVEGELTEGARLRVRLQPPGSKGITLSPRVQAVRAMRELRWRGRVLLPGIFTGEHRFLLEPRGGGTRFVQSEQFSGVLVPLLKKQLDGATREGFHQMNTALRLRAEMA
jgi:hypothetical protein